MRPRSSTTRGGKELPTRSMLGSPFLSSQLAALPHVIQSDMSQVIDNASTVDYSHDDAYTMHAKFVSLPKLLDVHIAKAEESEVEENPESLATPSTPTRTKMLYIPDGYTLLEESTRELIGYDTRNGIEGFMTIRKAFEPKDEI